MHPIIKVCDTESRVQCYKCSILMPEGFCCDKCLEKELRILLNLGIKTTGSCCGNHINSRSSGYIGVTDEFIPVMKKLGYKVAHNSSRPGDEDEFVPKTIFQVNDSTINPRDVKEKLAKIIVTQYHGAEAAEAAAAEFRRVFGNSGLPNEIPEITLPDDKMNNGKIKPIDLITHCQFENSRSKARQLIAQRGVKLNGQIINDSNIPIVIKSGDILQRGKRKFIRLIVQKEKLAKRQGGK